MRLPIMIFGVLAFSVTILILPFAVPAQAIAHNSGEGKNCDFFEFKPLSVSHLLLKSVVKKVDPKYPATARAVGVTGEVVLAALVDRNGNVVRTCVVKGHPLLQDAAVTAAKRWKFGKNFGFRDYPPRERFVKTEIVFRFSDPGAQ